MSSFADIGIDQWLVKGLDGLAIRTPTEIQQNCIPAILRGKNAVCAAQTGSGKSLTFILPILQKLAKDPYGVFAVVLAPTRELAMQIADQFKVLGVQCSLKLSLIVGGVDMMAQAVELQRKPHVIVATPGRLADHINSSTDTVFLRRIRFLVLDEADKLLNNETLFGDLKCILQAANGPMYSRQCQNLLFSATIVPEEAAFQRLWAIGGITPPDAFEAFYYASTVALSNSQFSIVESLDQRYLPVPKPVRYTYLVYLLLNSLQGKTVIIFLNKCKTCEFLRYLLKELGIDVVALHAQMPQKLRMASLSRFKSNMVKVMLATDVGSRGLDIPQAHAVINFNMPAKTEDYVHRVGRTARAGRGGQAISFIGRHDLPKLLQIESETNRKLLEFELSENSALKLLNKVTAASRNANLQLLESKFGEKHKINKEKWKN